MNQNKKIMRLGIWVLVIGFVIPMVTGLGLWNLGSAATSTRNRPVQVYDSGYEQWDVAAASENIPAQSKKKYTLMVYMNGSDLESESGAATSDLHEMLAAQPDTGQYNLLLFTGGTNRWQNNVIPENTCAVWRITPDGLQPIAAVGLYNMGNPETLAGFIDFSIQNFPAEKYGLIMWDHGGGSIAGYGHDENFNEGSLSLPDMQYAFEKTGLAKNKLEFLGFDSCLMASVEMAVVASGYAKYLIASEDLEPGDGWNYQFLSALNHDPSMNGEALGKKITDSFMAYYGEASEEILSMSVTDLSKISPVMDAMGNLMNACNEKLTAEKMPAFASLAKKRYNTKTFGEGSPRDNECDMVDIGDMANKLSDWFPDEAHAVQDALGQAVTYHRNNAVIPLGGLSTFYIYGGKDYAYLSLPAYASLNMNSNYTGYLFRFAEYLGHPAESRTSGTRSRSSSVLPASDSLLSVSLTLWQPIPGAENRYQMTGIRQGIEETQGGEAILQRYPLWPTLNGKPICLYPINHAEQLSFFAIPAVVNGADSDIIVVISKQHPEGKILGTRKEDGFILQKGFDPLQDGDTVSLYLQERSFSENAGLSEVTWRKGEPITVESGLQLGWAGVDVENTVCKLLLTDIWLNEYYTAVE